MIPRLTIISIIIISLFFNQLYISGTQKRDQIETINQELPPALALTSVALGPLKGIIASGLLWRAAELEQKKEYMDCLLYTSDAADE